MSIYCTCSADFFILWDESYSNNTNVEMKCGGWQICKNLLDRWSRSQFFFFWLVPSTYFLSSDRTLPWILLATREHERWPIASSQANFVPINYSYRRDMMQIYNIIMISIICLACYLNISCTKRMKLYRLLVVIAVILF